MMDNSDFDPFDPFNFKTILGDIDPWSTALGKAYMCLCKAVDTALILMECPNYDDAYKELFMALRKAEEYLISCNHPLDMYIPCPWDK